MREADQTFLTYLAGKINGARINSRINANTRSDRAYIDLERSEVFALLVPDDLQAAHVFNYALHYYQQCGYQTLHQYGDYDRVIFVAKREDEMFPVSILIMKGHVFVEAIVTIKQ
jgi:hypothetical protein